MPGLEHVVTISAPPARVWEVLADVERWPERIPTVDAAERLDEGRSFTWESRSPGVAISASHVVEPHAGGTCLALAVDVSGPVAPLGWLLTRRLTRRYVETEAASISRAAEEGAA